MTDDERKELIEEFKQYSDLVDTVVEHITDEIINEKLEMTIAKVRDLIKMQPYPECKATEHDFESKGCICLDKWLEELRGTRETSNRLGDQTTN